jgi:crossover junction endodeoxyribonuclease RuvC
MMRVLGLDPGTATTGYGVVEKRGNRLRHIAHGVITTAPGEPFAARLRTIFERCRALISQHAPDAAAIEKVYFSQNVTTGISVAQARGVIALAAEMSGLPISEFSPLEVKNSVVGYGKAVKQQVQEMTKILLNLEELPKPDDAADALALAICLLHTAPVERLRPR